MMEQPSRRRLLAGATAALALPWVARAGLAAPTPRALPDSAWRELARTAGWVVRPDDAAFRNLIRPQNLRWDTVAPRGVVMPRNAGQMAAAIGWARRHGLPVVAKSGGHSYAGCSTTTGLLIHTGMMRRVRALDSDIVEFDGGALNSDLYTALASARSDIRPEGLAVTHGRCGGVGASAFLMGGGIGFAMRHWGMGCDLVQQVELVLADGRIVTASERENPDLFWAVRGGGGGNLGIATRWRLRAQPAEQVTVFRLSWDKGTESAYAATVRALEASPDRMGSRLNVFATRPQDPAANRMDLLGQIFGREEEARAILAPALATTPSARHFAEMPYWKAQQFLGLAGPPNRYAESSMFAAKLPDAYFAEAFRHLRTWPGTQAFAVLTLFQVGGRIAATAPDATAYVHREAAWLVNSNIDWTHLDSPAVLRAALDWQQRLQAGLAGVLGSRSAYQNFPDPALANPAEAYWGANLGRLQGIKRAADPDGVFTPPRKQGILA